MVASLWNPIRLQKPSNPLELMGRVELSLWVSAVQASFCLHPSDSADREGNGCACESHDSWETYPGLSGSLELEGFLNEVESGCFGVAS